MIEKPARSVLQDALIEMLHDEQFWADFERRIQDEVIESDLDLNFSENLITIRVGYRPAFKDISLDDLHPQLRFSECGFDLEIAKQEIKNIERLVRRLEDAKADIASAIAADNALAQREKV